MQLIACALDSLVHGDMFCSVDGNINLINRISALHVVYHINESKILWFSLLLSLSPGIMVHLKTTDVSDRTEMVWHNIVISGLLLVRLFVYRICICWQQSGLF